MTDKEKIQKLMEMLATLSNEAEYVLTQTSEEMDKGDYLDIKVGQARELLKEVDPSFDFNKF